jgi:hypothetical protein
METSMIYRKDITDFLFSANVESLNILYMKAHRKEKDNRLYRADYDQDTKKILSFSTLTGILWGADGEKIISEIKKKFPGVIVRKEPNNIICKCGEEESFSARIGSYELLLKCNKCGNEFSAYSG